MYKTSAYQTYEDRKAKTQKKSQFKWDQVQNTPNKISYVYKFPLFEEYIEIFDKNSYSIWFTLILSSYISLIQFSKWKVTRRYQFLGSRENLTTSLPCEAYTTMHNI